MSYWEDIFESRERHRRPEDHQPKRKKRMVEPSDSLLRVHLRSKLGLPHNAGDERIFQAVCQLIRQREHAHQTINDVVNLLNDRDYIDP